MFDFDYIEATALVHFFVPKTTLNRVGAYSSKYCIQIIKVNLHCILYVKSFVQKCKSGIFHDQERHPGGLCNFLFLFCSL